jgi:p-aminobenzoyl-glutamate transporter AbgT
MNILLALVVTIIMIAIGAYVTSQVIEPINKACENTNETITINSKKINCYDWKYNLTLEHPWPW